MLNKILHLLAKSRNTIPASEDAFTTTEPEIVLLVGSTSRELVVIVAVFVIDCPRELTDTTRTGTVIVAVPNWLAAGVTVTVRLDLDALTPAAIAAGALAGLPVTVLGLARTGTALARFFADAGARVTVYDGQPVESLGEAIVALEGRPIALMAFTVVDGRVAEIDIVTDATRLTEVEITG